MSDAESASTPTTSTSSTSSTSTPTPARGAERRRNPRLRALIDEMLATIRENVNQDLWTPEERSTAEADLERIMRRVRETTFSAGTGGSAHTAA